MARKNWSGTAREMSKTQTLRNKGLLFFFSPLLLVGSQESVLTRAISCCDSCDTETLRFVCPRCTRETDGIAAKLSRCGIASEAVRQNMPLSSGCCMEGNPPEEQTVPTVLGVTHLKLLWGRYVFVFWGSPTVRNLEIQNLL